MAITLDGSDNKIAIGANATGSAYVRLYEDTDNGTNYVDIIAPASVTSNRTLTLPDNTGTILTSATTTGFPVGSVLQVVSATYSTQTGINSTSYVDTGLSASITPSSSSSKILIIIGQTMITSRATASIFAAINIVRGATQVMEILRANGIEAGTSGAGYFTNFGIVGFSYLDSPATTSSTTYKTQAKVNTTANSGYGEAQSGGSTSTLTLMEIAA